MISRFFDIERFIHSIKTGIACIAGLLLSKFIGFPADQWVVITIIVVMCAQIYVGSVTQKAYLRFIGTCVGCLFAISAIELIDNSLTTVTLTIGISSFIFSYIATSKENFSYAGTLGAVTTAIILLGGTPTIEFALERFLEISVGILIATVVSQFVLPIHARTHLRRTQGATLRQLRDLYIDAMMTPRSDALITNYLDKDETIVKTISKQRQLAKESAHEPKGSVFDPDSFMPPLYCEKEMLRAIDFMHDALGHLNDAQRQFLFSEEIKHFSEGILKALDTIIHVIDVGKPDDAHIHIPSLVPFKNKNGHLFYVEGFIFSAEILTDNLDKLARNYHICVVR